MRTGVVDGVELTVQVEQGDLLSLHLNQLAVVRFKLARLRYFDIFGHANLLDRSTILRRAVFKSPITEPSFLISILPFARTIPFTFPHTTTSRAMMSAVTFAVAPTVSFPSPSWGSFDRSINVQILVAGDFAFHMQARSE